MKYNLPLLIYSVVLVFLLSAIHPVSGQGLRFSGSPENTSLDLFSGESLKFSGNTHIGFDMKILDPDSFGQILTLNMNSEPLCLTLVSRNGNNPTLVLSRQNEREHYIEIPYPEAYENITKWSHCTISICPDQKNVRMTFLGKEWVLDSISVPKSFRMNVLFGGNTVSIVESPEMCIKDISIYEDRESIEFPLDEYSGNIVNSDKRRIKGKVTSPHWLAHDHYYWKKICEFKADKAAGVTYDSNRDRIAIINRDSLFFVCIDRGVCTIRKEPVFPSSLPVGYSGEAVYDPERDFFYFYNLIDKAGVASPFFATIGSEGHVEYVRNIEFNNPLHHHAFTFFDEKKELYIFGGYSNFSYSGRIFMFDFEEGRWRDIAYTGDRISPRMHTVSGKLSDKEMLIFGGVGNEIGRQELGKDFYYDLYLFDTEKREMKKLWQVKEDALYVPTRNIVTDKENRFIYILCRDRGSKAFLKRFNLDTGQSETVSDELFNPTNDILSSYYLFSGKNNEKFYAVDRHSDGKEALITVYQLNMPPVPLSQISGASSSNPMYILLPAAVFLALCCVVFFAVIKVRRNSKAWRSEVQSFEEDEVEPEDAEHGKFRSNSVLFFGEFAIIDRNGENISSRLGQKLRQLLSCIMIYSENYGGITTQKLTSAIWPERTTSEAKNVRGASISHLRTLLKDIDGLEIVFEDNKWKVNISDNLFWDYAEAKCKVLELLRCDEMDYESVIRLISIIKRGSLLPSFVKYAWFDSIKIDSDDIYCQVLERILPFLLERNDFRNTLLCSDILFSIDIFSKTALYYKTTCLKHMGKPHLAKQVEERFYSEARDFEQ